jgi:hypothetical protein
VTVERALRLIAGAFVILSVLLGIYVNVHFLWLTLFVGLNLFQSAFTNWCPMMTILRKGGLPERLGAVALLVAGGTLVASAQPAGPGRYAGPMYDVKTETTMRGTVESLETVAGMGGRGHRSMGGTHLVLKTEKDAVGVHVGPTAYLAEKGIALATGDVLEITGSRLSIDGEPVLIAKQITKGNATWTLRDASGRPVWSGRGRSGSSD